MANEGRTRALTGSRAYEIHGLGGIDSLVSSTRDVAPPGESEVLVRLHASAVNYRDLTTVEDPGPRNLSYPCVPNSDGAGEVVSVGGSVTRFSPGDRVASNFFTGWIDGPITPAAMATALGGARDGLLREHAVLPESALVALPAHLDFAQSATLPCAALTAWHSLMHVGQVRAGDTVLLLGTGGVSIFALQFCAMHNVRTIITSSSDAKLERARSLGAWRTINYRERPAWDDEVLALTDGHGVDHAVEVGGAGTIARTVNATRVAGSIGLIGVLSSGEFNPTLIMRKSIRLHGVYVGSRTMFEAMVRAIEAAQMEPVLDQVFDYEQAREAFHRMRGASHFGKLVVRIQPD